MYLSRSLLASAALFFFSSTTHAGVALLRADSQHEDAVEENKLGSGRIFPQWSLRNFIAKRQESGDLICSDTPESDILRAGDPDDQQTFCNRILEMPPATTVVDFMPIQLTNITGISTSTITETTRILVTTTETPIAAPLPAVRRAANRAARNAIANDIFTSVLVAQTTASSIAIPTNVDREEAIREMSTACACLNPDPTSTVTSTYTAPEVPTTRRSYRVQRKTELVTKAYTTTVTARLAPVATQSLNGTASTASVITDSITVDSSASSLPTFSTIFDGSTTTSFIATPTVITTGGSGIIPLPTATSAAGPLVVGLPFSCPGDNGKRVSNIVGSKRYEYEVLCDTAAVTGNGKLTDGVSNPTECAAECSLFNDAFRGDECQVATFTAAAGTERGDCLISGATTNFVSSPGSVTLVHTATFSGGDTSGSCDVDTSPSGANSVSVDTSSLVASISAATISLSTPGFVTGGSTGYEFKTFFSTGSTDSLGVYRYNWYELYYASASWYAIYATSWSCTSNIPRTIVLQQPGNVTSVALDVTTIINGGTTTIVSGTFTSTFTAGSGASTPPPVPASTTSGGNAFSTGFSTATQSARSGEGAETLAATSLPSGAISSQLVANETSVLASGTGRQGSAGFMVSSDFFTANSTGGVGTIFPPSTASGGTQVMVSSGSSPSNSTRGDGSVVPAPTSGVAQITISGETFTANSTGGFGSNLPSLTSGVAVGTISSTAVVSNSTGGGGYGQQTGSSQENAPANSTGGLQTASSGAAQLTESGRTFTANSTGGSGAITPTAASNQTSNPSESVTVGSAVVTAAGNTSILLSTGGTGFGQAATHTVNVTSEVTIAVTTTTTLLATGTVSGNLNTANSTGSSAVTLPSVNTTIPGPSMTLIPSGNISIAIPGTGSASSGAANFTTFGGTAVTSFIEGSGAISPSVNISTVAPSATPLPSANTSIPITGTGVSASGEQNFTTSGATVIALSTQGSGAVSPSANVTVPPAPSLTPSPSLNASQTTLDIDWENGDRNGRWSRTRGLLNSTAPPGTEFSSGPGRTGYSPQPSASLPTPAGNVTSTLGTGQASITPPPASVNISSVPSVSNTSDFDFSNTFGPRKGSYSRSSTPSASLPLPTGNTTLLPGTSVASNCPTPTGSTISLETIIVTHTIPLAPSTCLFSGTALPSSNATLPFNPSTGNLTIPQPTYSTTTTANLASASAALSRYRRAGETATSDQIAVACADKTNIVFNPAFEDVDDNNAFGWTSVADDSFISFRTFPSDTQHTPSGTRSGRVLSAAPYRSVTISQPLTLCPGQQYRLSSWNRQANILAQCTVEYSIGDDVVFTASPQEDWVERSEFFTTGDSVGEEGASRDLRVKVSCAGQGGATVGADDAGFMTVDFDDVEIVQV